MISHSGRKRVAASKAKPSKTRARIDDINYAVMLVATKRAFNMATAGGARLFETDAGDLWSLYLKNLPEGEGQFHNCRCCRKFIERFGSLVTIDEKGHTTPAMWAPDGSDFFYEPSFSAMFHRVKAARVTGVFLCKDAVWGTPETPGWTHLSVTPLPAQVYRERALTAGQAMAAKKQDFITVSMALSEFTAPMLAQALRLFDSDALARSEKFLGPTQWLQDLHFRPKGRLGENVLWRAIATAPEGYCHPKSSVLGPLLEDIRLGKPYEEIKRSFEAMMHPLRYQRPQAAPAAQNIKAAEELIERLGFARSLERRFARLDEVQTAWMPGRTETEKAQTASGVFSHLIAKEGSGHIKAVDLPEATLTAEKFLATVVPSAERMEFLVPVHGNFMAMLTAEHADAPIIHKWGYPISWYIYHDGSPASQWGLSPTWVPVTALVRSPPMALANMTQWGDGYLIVLRDCYDSRYDAGNALFPETLISELHSVRSTIEAYSKMAKIGGRGQASVCGHFMGQGDKNLRVRVFTNGGWTPYLIDRWS
jgi:hypothetical protein